MKVDAHEEEGCTVSMKVSYESAVVNISGDVGYGGEGGGDIGCIVYGKK